MSQREKLITIHPTTQKHLSGLSGQPQTPHVPKAPCVLASVQLPGESEPKEAFQGLILQSQKNLRAEMGQLSDRGWAWFTVAAEGWGTSWSDFISCGGSCHPWLSIFICLIPCVRI